MQLNDFDPCTIIEVAAKASTRIARARVVASGGRFLQLGSASTPRDDAGDEVLDYWSRDAPESTRRSQPAVVDLHGMAIRRA